MAHWKVIYGYAKRRIENTTNKKNAQARLAFFLIGLVICDAN